MGVIFLDTETTGNMPATDRLCSIAYKLDGELHHELFKPPIPVSVDAMATHHITNEMLADKPMFADSETFQTIQTLLNDHILVAHNAAFDIGILKNEGLQVPRHICTYRVARQLDKEGVIPRFGLQYLRYYLKLNVDNAPAHDAAGDVLVLEALYNRLAAKLTPEEMVTISQQPVFLHRINFGKHKGKLLKDVAQSDRGYLQWLLGEKENATADKRGADDEDWIYSLKRHLTIL